MNKNRNLHYLKNAAKQIPKQINIKAYFRNIFTKGYHLAFRVPLPRLEFYIITKCGNQNRRNSHGPKAKKSSLNWPTTTKGAL